MSTGPLRRSSNFFQMGDHCAMKFMDLPFEIKENIYRHVLGHQFIEIETNTHGGTCEDTRRWYRIPRIECAADEPSARIGYEALSLPRHNHPEQHVTCVNREEDQVDSAIWHLLGRRAFKYDATYGTAHKYVRLHADLLKTCRQIKDHASGVLYSTNIFSFATAADLELFMAQITTMAQSQIRYIHIAMFPTFNSADTWQSAFESKFEDRDQSTERLTQAEKGPLPLWKAMESLRSVYVTMEEPFGVPWALFAYTWLLPLLNLRQQCFRDASVIVGRAIPMNPHRSSSPWNEFRWRGGVPVVCNLTLAADAQRQIRRDYRVPWDRIEIFTTYAAYALGVAQRKRKARDMGLMEPMEEYLESIKKLKVLGRVASLRDNVSDGSVTDSDRFREICS